FHGEGQQEVPRQRRMGMGRLRLRRGVRYIQALRRGKQTAAGTRCEVRVRVPHGGAEARLRFHGVRKEVSVELREPTRLPVASARAAAWSFLLMSDVGLWPEADAPAAGPNVRY